MRRTSERLLSTDSGRALSLAATSFSVDAMTRHWINVCCVAGLLGFVGCEEEVPPSAGEAVLDKGAQRLAAAEMQLARGDVLSVEGATVEAYILDGGSAVIVDESEGIRRVLNTTRKARLANGGEEIHVWVPSDVWVPEGSLVDVRVGEYGYYFEAFIHD